MVGNGVILTSSDEVTWAPPTSYAAFPAQGVAYGNNTFVAVGQYKGVSTTPSVGFMLETARTNESTTGFSIMLEILERGKFYII